MFVLIILKYGVMRQINICLKEDHHVKELLEISLTVTKETLVKAKLKVD